MLPPVIIAVGGTWWHAASVGSFSWYLLCWSVIVGLALATIGATFLAAITPLTQLPPEPISSLSTWLVGCILASSGLLFLSVVSPFCIDVNCALLVLAALSALAFKTVRAGWRCLSMGWLELLVLLLLVVAARFWSQENLAAIGVYGNSAVAYPWVDAFVHATLLGLFAHAEAAVPLSNPWLVGQSLPVYHYGGYMAGSLLCHLTGLDAYSLAVAWYAPLGLLLTGLAAWALGSSLLGPWGGLGSVCLTLLIPDPSYYGMGSRWTSYFFFQTVGVGGAYAVAVLGMAWAFLFTYLRTGGLGLLLAALLFGGASVLFKAQMFLVYSFALLLFAALFAPRIGWPTKAVLLGGVVFALYLGASVLPRVPNAPTLALDPSQVGVNLGRILSNAASTVTPQLQAHWRSLQISAPGMWSAGAIVLETTYGALLLVLLLGFGISLVSGRPCTWNAFPLFMLANHFIVAVCLAPNKGVGDEFEVVHKTFVLPYFAVAAWSGATLFAAFAGQRRGVWVRKVVLVALIGAALLMVRRAGEVVQAGMPLLARRYTRIEIPRGFYDTARFIREHTPTGSVVQFSDKDGFSVLTALGERKAYVSHPTVNTPPANSEEVRRLQEVATLQESPTADVAIAAAAAIGIDWLLLSPNRQPPWAAQLTPAFESQGFRLYRLRLGAAVAAGGTE